MKHTLFIYLVFMVFLSCGPEKTQETDLSDRAANEEVAKYLREFEGRGALTDDSEPTKPEDALRRFKVAEDLSMDLVLSEPDIHQPVEMKFDRKGRLWVVQYNQYPFPEGLKITGIDNHLRLKFDTIPLPPPTGRQGADRITFFEDSNGDGIFDQSTDAITGLNITTSVLLGRGKIWVLSPPYLLAYPDPDRDGLPDGEPVVHLRGFGLEDTHAVANSLRWGPDGWIYGAQGSTTTANISSEASKNIAFSGQAIWRYHPETYIFEVFAEGGGNTFNVEIDGKGRIYSGQNGYGRGPYYKQGGYYKKSWGKHGPLTNPYAFGFLPDMALDGEKLRFTHAEIRYEGGSLPPRYHQQMIALNALQSEVVLTGMEQDGSTYKTRDIDKIVQTEDRWFRPIDIKTGPDGRVYFTDWYDSRLSHVDPRDTWSKTTGRIYRLRNKSDQRQGPVLERDLTTLSSDELVHLFHHKNKWYRFAAIQELADRQSKEVVPGLVLELKKEQSPIALESLWGVHILGGFSDAVKKVALAHENPFVREWAVRLIGDRKKASKQTAGLLIAMAATEPDVNVRSQLAASARRLPGGIAIPVLRALILHHDDSDDIDIPLMIWWAVEAHTESSRNQWVAFFKDPKVWGHPLVQEILLPRITQRYAMSGGVENYTTAQKIIQSAPSSSYMPALMMGLEEGLRGRDVRELPKGLQKIVEDFRRASGEPELAVGLRSRDTEVVSQVMKQISDESASQNSRLAYLRILEDTDVPALIPDLLKVLSSSSSGVIQQSVLQALSRYEDPMIGEKIVQMYPHQLRADRAVRESAIRLLVMRPEWTKELLDEITVSRIIHRTDVPSELVSAMILLGNDEISQRVYKIWPEAKTAGTEEKNARIAAIQAVLNKGSGRLEEGKMVFATSCGVCHRLDGEGGEIGPDLTGYDRRNTNYFIAQTIDPNAEIREGYVTYTLKTTDGRYVTGRITARSSESVTLKDLSGRESTYSMNQVQSLEPQPVSLMPERLLDGLSDQEVRDLFAYIQDSSF